MIIKSAAGKAFAGACLAAITTFAGAHAQMGPAPGSYWGPPGAPYGYAPSPYGPPPGAYGPPIGNLCPAEPICPTIGWTPPDNQRTAGQPG